MALGVGKMMLNSSNLPMPLKLVGNNVIGNLQKPKKKQTSLVSSAKSMSPCVYKMFQAIANPWSPSAAGACIPVFPARPSQKVTAFSRFDFVVGTQGVGFVTIAPTIANDAPLALLTTAAYTGGAGPADVTFTAATGAIATTGVVYTTMGNLPYGAASGVLTANIVGVAQQVHGRIISTGVTVSYTGTTMNQSGLLYCYSDPVHDNVSTYSLITLGTRTETDVTGVSRDKCSLVCYPIDRNECEYDRSKTASSSSSAVQIAQTTSQNARSDIITTLFPFSDGQDYNTSSNAITTVGISTIFAGAPLVIIASGCVAGSTFHVEIVTHAEYIGIGCEGKTTASGFDSVGAELLLAAVGKLPSLRQAYPSETTERLITKGMSLLRS